MKKILQPGFLLLESLIYLSLITALSFIAIPFFLHVSQQLYISNKESLASIRFNNVKDLLVRDLMFASSNPAHWNSKQLSFVHEMVGEHGKIDQKLIRWLNDAYGVKRSVQNYDSSKNRFNRQGVSGFPTSMYNLALELYYDKDRRYVTHIVASYNKTKQGKISSLSVRLLNKELVI